MWKPVFISHSTQDKSVALAICERLESAGIACWIAPRDVLPGADYAASIIEGLSQSRLLVLVFSQHANRSSHVIREVERAASKGLQILVYRIEPESLCKPFEYFLSASQRMEAGEPLAGSALSALSERVTAMLAEEITTLPTVADPKRAKAEAELREADAQIARGLSNAEAHKDRALAYERLGAHPQALEDFTHAIRLDPSNANLYYLRSTAYYNAHDFEHAEADLTQALQLKADPDSGAVGYSLRAMARSQLGNVEGAVADYSEAIRINPNCEAFYMFRADLHARLGRYEAVVGDCNEALRVGEGQNAADIRCRRAAALHSLRRFDDATADASIAISLDPRRGDAYYRRGLARFEMHQYDEAVDDLAVSIRLDPTNAGAIIYRAWSYFNAGRFRAAIDDLNEAVRLQPELAGPYFLRGKCYLALRHYSRAVCDLRDSLRFGLDIGHGELAEALFHVGDSTAAMAEADEAVRLSPDRDNWHLRGAIGYNSGDFEVASESFDKCLEFSPHDAELLNECGRAWLRRRHYSNAVERFRASLELNVQNADAWCELGVAHYELGDHSKALDCFNRSLEADPTYSLAEKNRNALLNQIDESPTRLGPPPPHDEQVSS